MSDSYRYFIIPFPSVPVNPSYAVWFALWSPDRPRVHWTTDRPPTGAAWVVGATDEGELPDAAEVIGLSTKCLPPPPLDISPNTAGVSALRAELAAWLKRLPDARTP